MNLTEERELLLSYRPWLRKVALGMCRQFPEQSEDVAAEGWVALWRSIRSYPGNEDVPADNWLKAAALNKMRSAVRNHTAQCRDARLTALAGLPGMRESDKKEVDIWDALCVDLGAVELAYHHGEIMEAVNALPPKQRLYVFLKYWKGYTDTELITIFGYRPKTLGTVAHAKLSKELAHLGAE